MASAPLTSGGAVADQRPDAELGRLLRAPGGVLGLPGGLPEGLRCNPSLVLWVHSCSPRCPLPATGMEPRTESRRGKWESREERQAAETTAWAPRSQRYVERQKGQL